MKSFDEIEKSVREKAEKRITENKHRRAVAFRSGAFVFGAAAILGIGIFANALKPPQKPTAESSGIISNTTEAVTTSAKSSVQTSAKSVTTPKHSPITTSAQTETAASKTTSSTTETVTQTSSLTKKTTAKTTLATAVTTHTQTKTSSRTTTASVTSPSRSTTKTPTNTTTASTVSVRTDTAISRTTAVSSQTHTALSTTTKEPVSGEFPPDTLFPYQYGEVVLNVTEKTYVSGGVYEKTENIGELIDTVTVRITYPGNSQTVNADVYSIRGIDPEKAVLLNIWNKYILYRNTEFTSAELE